MPIEKGDAGIIIIFLVIGITSIVMFLVYFHLRKSRQAGRRTAEDVVGIEQRYRRAYQRRLREPYERGISAVSGNPAEPPSYVVTVDNDLRPPPPSYQDHRRDTRIT